MKEIEAYFPKDYLARQGGSVDEVIDKLEKGTARFSDVLARLDESVFQQPVSEGKWSPAEIADHVVRVNRNLAKAIARTAEGREPLVLPRGTLSSEGRPLSPESGLPEPGRPLEALLSDLQETREAVTNAAKEAERSSKADEQCMVQPFLGPMSVLECFQMVSWHVRHHHRQLPGEAAR